MKYTKGNYKYQLAEDEVCESGIPVPGLIHTPFFKMEVDGVITAYAGYAWDGASGPTINTENTIVPSLFHDVGAQIQRMELIRVTGSLPPRLYFNWEDIDYRWQFDNLLDRLLKERGMWAPRRWLWKRGVRSIFADGSVDPKNKRKVYEAE